MYLNVPLRIGVADCRYALQLHRVPHQQLDQRRDLHLRHLVPSGDGFLDAGYLRTRKISVSPYQHYQNHVTVHQTSGSITNGDTHTLQERIVVRDSKCVCLLERMAILANG